LRRGTLLALWALPVWGGCDGSTEGDTGRCSGHADLDGDGFGEETLSTFPCSADGWVLNDVDCDDADPLQGGANYEVPYNGRDDDCDAATVDDDFDGDGRLRAADCDDGDARVGGDEMPYDGIDNDCDPATPDDDLDADGHPARVDCADDDPDIGARGQDSDCDGVDDLTDCAPDDAARGGADDADCDGASVALDCDDADAARIERSLDTDCDGVLWWLDCDDADPTMGAWTGDVDCDGVPAADDCDDRAADRGDTAVDADCDGLVAADDCDDTDGLGVGPALDADCDGVRRPWDCDDTDPSSTTRASDADCDGIVTAVDCDDTVASTWSRADDADCDGSPTGEDCDDDDPMVFHGGHDRLWIDGDCDGVMLDSIDAADARLTWGEETPHNVGYVGDVDGGGKADLAVGLHRVTIQGLIERGVVAVVPGESLRSGEVDLRQARHLVAGVYGRGAAGDGIGGGDVDGDGVSDLLIGASAYYAGGLAWSGRVHVVRGGALPSLVQLADEPWFFDGEASLQYIGKSPQFLGDVDGDGLPDLAFDEYLAWGSDLGSNEASLVSLDPEGELLRPEIAGGGDVDGDGQLDLVGRSDRGLAVVLGGSHLLGLDGEVVWAEQADFEVIGDVSSPYILRDLDDDGLDDIVLHSPASDTVAVIEGAELQLQAFPLRGEHARLAVGLYWEHVPAGDVDGDGRGDLLAIRDTHTVVLVTGTELAQRALRDADALRWSLASDDYIFEVAGVGDVDGDGLDDFAVATSLDAAHLFFSPFGGGL